MKTIIRWDEGLQVWAVLTKCCSCWMLQYSTVFCRGLCNLMSLIQPDKFSQLQRGNQHVTNQIEYVRMAKPPSHESELWMWIPCFLYLLQIKPPNDNHVLFLNATSEAANPLGSVTLWLIYLGLDDNSWSSHVWSHYRNMTSPSAVLCARKFPRRVAEWCHNFKGHCCHCSCMRMSRVTLCGGQSVSLHTVALCWCLLDNFRTCSHRCVAFVHWCAL